MDLIEQLKRDEGVRFSPYVDTTGHTTVGVGRNISDVPFSPDEVDLMLSNDIRRVQDALGGHAWYDGLDVARQAAVANMAFNLGMAGLLHFPTMLHCLQGADWVGAAAAALDSRWAQQVGARAQRIAEQLRSGQWV